MSQRDSRLIGGVYRVNQVISSRGMLTTCTAYNRNTNDVLGLYIIDFPPTVPVEQVQRLLQVYERRRSMQSPNAIHLYDWGIDGARVYIATDPPRGITLRYVLDTEYVDLQRTLELVRQMARGVKELHDHGVIGLDLRPQLITIDTTGVVDRVQIDDIGLRQLLISLGYVTDQRPDDIGLLDPRYAAPEYINAGQISASSDIYQLGLLLFELTTGRLPFVGSTLAESGVMQSTQMVPRMAQFKHDTPSALQELVDRALEKNPVARLASADAFLQALEQVTPSPRPLPQGKSLPLPGNRTTPSTTGFTQEMPQVGEDATIHVRPIHQPPVQRPQPDPSESGVYAYLCVEKDGKEVQRFAITQPAVVVGRLDPKRGTRPDIDLTKLDPNMTVSRLHARIRFEDSFFYLEDLKSRNKTRLGELTLEPLKTEYLQHGDIVRFGSVHLTFKVPGMSKHLDFKEKK